MFDESLVSGWARGKTRLTRGENVSEYIPTWIVGQEQQTPDSLRRYLEDGYSKNSLIYACVRVKAKSFGPLVPQVVRSNGEPQQPHRMVRLLRNPNTYQTGKQFAELLATQYEAAGNAYIEMAERSSNLERRREFATFPIQELHLWRPDNVSIVPGRTREQDVFVLTVDGEVKRRVPRQNMIHVHEPNLINDFYGLSKIALLTREGAIDLEMSDFELSFFRNAGVPMGLLSVKGRMPAQTTEEIKSRFRKAYNGVKKWFDLLVLNADTATYTPMGTAPKDMEMDGTRFHVESRICSVFDVPGAIVGARYAMQQGGATAPYEEIEHAFWAEGMMPLAETFAAAWEKYLLPRFATTRDTNATVAYDTTGVRALQEDRSRKMREVVRMINTGAFTRDEALLANGMDAIGGNDFYVRTGNQVTVDKEGNIVQMQPPGSTEENPDNPLEGAAEMQTAPAGVADRPIQQYPGGPMPHRSDEQRAIDEALSIFKLGRNGHNG